MMNRTEWDELCRQVIGACIEVHRFLGPGLTERVYAECLCRELTLRSIFYEREYVIPVLYKGISLDIDLRADLVIEKTLVLELKSVKELSPLFESQLISYLRLSELPIGLLVNFNVNLLKDGVKRLYAQPASDRN